LNNVNNSIIFTDVSEDSCLYAAIDSAMANNNQNVCVFKINKDGEHLWEKKSSNNILSTNGLACDKDGVTICEYENGSSLLHTRLVTLDSDGNVAVDKISDGTSCPTSLKSGNIAVMQNVTYFEGKNTPDGYIHTDSSRMRIVTEFDNKFNVIKADTCITSYNSSFNFFKGTGADQYILGGDIYNDTEYEKSGTEGYIAIAKSGMVTSDKMFPGNNDDNDAVYNMGIYPDAFVFLKHTAPHWGKSGDRKDNILITDKSLSLLKNIELYNNYSSMVQINDSSFGVWEYAVGRVI
jgi:hypothetical protein